MEGKIRALVVKKLGDPKVPLSDEERCPVAETRSWPRPALTSPTSVRVRVKATSVNFSTVLQIQGLYQEKPKLPFVPGGDFSGVVTEVGPRVTQVKVGDRVCGLVNSGSFAEEFVADESEMFLVPSGCDLVAAGGLPVVYGTSHLALEHRANLRPGQVLLVLGAAGGVGLAAVQLGKLLGAIVIAVARGKEKVDLLRSQGADYVLDPTEGGVLKPVQAFLKSKKLKGVDVLYDPVGGKLHKEALKLVKWGGQILIIGFASGEIPSIPANIALVKNWTVHGLYWGSYSIHQPDTLRESMKRLLSWVVEGKLNVHISHQFPLSQANLAFATIMDRKVIGKVVFILEEKLSRL
ncbi:hypothetical protein R1flu_007394 [Riccia fluitans]|uniref:Enoyl reductase (ER) domain-containing protein n=1 Tax=Riccia fluitans TaxID=41844 RepID=A0ABD1YYR3_9MARC